MEDIGHKKVYSSKELLREFRSTEVIKYKSIYDHVFNKDINQLVNQQKNLTYRQFKLYKKLLNNINFVKIFEYEQERNEVIIMPANESLEFIKWRQSIVAKEFFVEIGKNNKSNKSKIQKKFIEEMKKGKNILK